MDEIRRRRRPIGTEHAARPVKACSQGQLCRLERVIDAAATISLLRARWSRLQPEPRCHKHRVIVRGCAADAGDADGESGHARLGSTLDPCRPAGFHPPFWATSERTAGSDCIPSDPTEHFKITRIRIDTGQGRKCLVGGGAPGRDRTCDHRIRSPLLYPLSYGRSTLRGRPGASGVGSGADYCQRRSRAASLADVWGRRGASRRSARAPLPKATAPDPLGVSDRRRAVMRPRSDICPAPQSPS